LTFIQILLMKAFIVWWRRRELRLHWLRQLDRPALRLATHALWARAQPSRFIKLKKGDPFGPPFFNLVEAAGIEPASVSTLPLALHA
tara:strand:- start:105 stop:365 length:261 start_codon:yes stop_codon:yes gene_type:complete